MPTVWIIDDEEIPRKGAGAALEGRPGITGLRLMTHEEALALPSSEWASCNVAVVDPSDPRIEGDQFPGVKVVRKIRAANPAVLILVATNHYLDDALRRRMREACADRFYHKVLDLSADGALLAAVLTPPSGRSKVPPPRADALYALGVGSNSNVEAAVHWWEDNGHVRAVVRKSRRGVARLRKTFNEVAHLQPRNNDGTLPDRLTQRDPGMPQIERFIQWATKIKDPM